MKITPLDIRHQEFPTGFSGYSKREVRDFLSRLANQFEDQEREVRSWQERINKLEQTIEEMKAGEDALKRAIISAEQLGSELKASAEREADLVIREAEATKERMLAEVMNQLGQYRSDLDRLSSERSAFINQFRSMLHGYLGSIESLNEMEVKLETKQEIDNFNQEIDIETQKTDV